MSATQTLDHRMAKLRLVFSSLGDHHDNANFVRSIRAGLSGSSEPHSSTLKTSLPASNEEKDESEVTEHGCATENKAVLKTISDNFAASSEAGMNVSLIVGGNGSRPIIWGAVRHALTWSVTGDFVTFKGVVQEAFDSWQDVCDVQFVKVPRGGLFNIRWATDEEETDPHNKGVVASAFFPGEAVRDIRLFAIWKTQGNALGALRHEIGHTLGFRHEHTRFAAKITPEKPDGVFLTEADKKSIMNYGQLYDDINNGIVSDLSDLDGVGARLMYGAPRSLADQLM